MLKVFTDIIFAVLSLLLVSPLLLAAAITLLIADRQNPFFLQARIGQHKKPFTIVKLRTMKNGTVTRFGGILRKTGIDELPQLINILSGKMSFIGPRPLTTQDIERLGWGDEYHRSRWSQRPGITGLAQLSPVCNKKISWFLDRKYIECHSFLLDMKILAASVVVPFAGKKKAASWLYSNR